MGMEEYEQLHFPASTLHLWTELDAKRIERLSVPISPGLLHLVKFANRREHLSTNRTPSFLSSILPGPITPSHGPEKDRPPQ